MDNYDIIEKEAVKDAKRRVDAAGEKLSPFLAELVKACGVGKPAAKAASSGAGGNTGNSGTGTGTGSTGNSGTGTAGNTGNSGTGTGNSGSGTVTGTVTGTGHPKVADPKVDPKAAK